jgi:hypothetical protein
MISQGNGQFTAHHTRYPKGWNFGTNHAHWSTIVGDWNGDGKTDFMRLSPTYAHAFISNGNGQFTAHHTRYPKGWNFGTNHAHWQTIVGNFASNHAAAAQRKAEVARSFKCTTRSVLSNNAGVIRVAPHGGYTMTGGGMVNNYRHWNSRAGFEEMMPEGGNYRCDMGFGSGRLTCYNQACKMTGGITCKTWSRRLTKSGVMRVGVGAGYTMTGGGIYNHYRHFNARSGFEESFPEGNHWRGDMGFGWGDFTVYARGCKAPHGHKLHCITAKGAANKNYAHAHCPSGYQLTGCGINNHYRHFNKLSGFEATHPSGNKCTCDSGFGTGRNTCYARCCKVV